MQHPLVVGGHACKRPHCLFLESLELYFPSVTPVLEFSVMMV